MKKLLALMLIFSMFLFVGCSDDDDKAAEFDTLITYLEGDDGGYINNMGSWIVSEGAVNLADYLVIDLRSAEVFAATPNPIAGAVHSSLSTMFDDVAGTTKPVLVTCYSGQTASYAHALLNLKGIEAYSMKFGMSWHDVSLDKWTSKCSEKNADDLVFTASPALPSFDYPELDTGEKDAEDILDARIEEAIAYWGSALIDADVVIGAPDNYNIINYWPLTDYSTYGHIDGAYQVTPGTISMDEDLSVFDPEGGNIFYCYTGQTAAASIAFLKVIGYDAQSIKYGFNNMNWAGLSGHKWPKPYLAN